MNALKPIFWLTSIILMSGCASHIPPEIRQAPENTPGVENVHENPESYIAQKIRWGGVIVQTENKKEASRLTIVAYPLNKYGEPVSSGQSSGRFIAISDEFLEPKTYTADRKVTIVGSLTKAEIVQVDEFAYQYPVVQVEQVYLWPARSEQQYRRRAPFWYDPWYSPFYGHRYRHHHLYYPTNSFYFQHHYD